MYPVIGGPAAMLVYHISNLQLVMESIFALIFVEIHMQLILLAINLKEYQTMDALINALFNPITIAPKA